MSRSSGKYKIKYQRRRRMRKVASRIRRNIRNLVDEVHCKLAKYLCETYHVILLPKFDTQCMVKRRLRKINSKTARAMMTWSHYRFRMHLLHKAREYPWCRVVIVNEAYTSETCGCCGAINCSSKSFVCRSCTTQGGSRRTCSAKHSPAIYHREF